MRAIALAGSPASGKSAVLKIVRSMGFPCIDCDAIVASLYGKKAVQKKLLGMFGEKSRARIATIVFRSPAKRRKLEWLLHPLAWSELRLRLGRLKKKGERIVFVEVPLLFEAKWEKRFDFVVFAKAPKRICLRRMAARGLSRKEALQRWSAQLSPAKKVKRADYVINTGGRLSKTKAKVRRLLGGLTRE